MLYTTIAFFALAALAGLFLLTFVLKGKDTPKAATFAHGFLAFTGVVLLIVYALDGGPDVTESIVLFVLAAMGGAYMLWRDLSRQPLPKWLAVGHGLLALAGFGFLLYSAFSGNA